MTDEPNPTEAELMARYGHLVLPAIHLFPGDGEGFSRLGGLPEMPPELDWPEWRGKPLAFMAQLSLAELHKALPSFLPAVGYLFFFYDEDQHGWGFDPEHKGSGRVLYVPGGQENFVERPAPIGLRTESVYLPNPVTPRRIQSFPQLAETPGSSYAQDGDAYLEMKFQEYGGAQPHQVWGHAMPWQEGSMELECQLVSNGIYRGGPEADEDPRLPGLIPGASEWKLLLQLHDDHTGAFNWCDDGTVYFWVRESDARRGDFSNVWTIFQTT
jgi:uncharacterized protein YwqG